MSIQIVLRPRMRPKEGTIDPCRTCRYDHIRLHTTYDAECLPEPGHELADVLSLLQSSSFKTSSKP